MNIKLFLCYFTIFKSSLFNINVSSILYIILIFYSLSIKCGHMTAFLLLPYSSHCFICGHVHDELIIECSQDVDYCNIMGRSPDWMPDILIRGGGYETAFYKKE